MTIRSDYDKNGYYIIKGLFDKDEISLLGKTINEDSDLKQAHTMPLDDNHNEPRFSLWYDLPNDLYSLYTRNEKIINIVEALLDEPCYQYHNKIVYKEPYTGGSWKWHQDYGYWYHYGFLFPKLISCMIAIDDSTIENGCLQIYRGSHCLGRIEHESVGKQMTPNEMRLKAVDERFEKISINLDKGDAVFFHCNLLHFSAKNTSAYPRRTLITCYNAVSNAPYKGYDIGKPHFKERHPRSTS
ncbi:phytanoyl-CoA dioxygenase family protein, partial [Pseudomonadota bacterium]